MSHHHPHPYLVQDIAFVVSLVPGIALFLFVSTSDVLERLRRKAAVAVRA